MPHTNIYVIEDDVDLRETMKELLETEGFSVLTAGNGQEGLNLIERDGQPCLILLDMMMPVMNGWEFLDTLQRDRRGPLAQTQVAVVTAAAEMPELQQQYGCVILKKPVNIERLFALAHAACDDC